MSYPPNQTESGDHRREAEAALSAISDLLSSEPVEPGSQSTYILQAAPPTPQDKPTIVSGVRWSYERTDSRPGHFQQRGKFKISSQMHDQNIAHLQGEETAEVVRGHRITVTTHDLRTLSKTSYLNDIIIDFYLQMIALRSQEERFAQQGLPKVYSFSTHHLSTFRRRGYAGVRSWTKGVNVFNHELLLFPVHSSLGRLGHWTLIAVDTAAQRISHYDSLPGVLSRAAVSNNINLVLDFLTAEATEQRQSFLPSHFSRVPVANTPSQQNSYDCGVFVCRTAEFLSRRSPLTFRQDEMAYYRQLMMWEISNMKIVIP